MYATLLADARFHELLLTIDRDLADDCRAEGCVSCRGPLHVANYNRKPRGRPCRLEPEHDRRFSFCCALDGCRSRGTPASLRFLSRKVYVTAIVVLIAILQHGVTDERSVNEAAFLYVAHDVGPRALSPKIKGFVQPKSWFVDFSTMTME